MIKIIDGIYAVHLGLYFKETIVISDIHIGYEEALNKQGVLIPKFQFEEIIKGFDNLFDDLIGEKVKRIIINGDLKHEFGKISETEWRHTIRLLDYLLKKCNEVILIKGNHDKILGPIARKKGIKIKDYEIIGGNLIIHGDKLPDTQRSPYSSGRPTPLKIHENSFGILCPRTLGSMTPNLCRGVGHEKILKDIKTIIIGHEHPAVNLKLGPREEKYKCFLNGKWKGYNLIVMPSFTPVTEGTDVLKNKLLSPFLKQDISEFEVFIVGDTVYDFGKLRGLM